MRINLYSISLLTALTCLSASGQALHVRATMPFNFRVGSVTLPAGEYDLEKSMSFLSLRQVDGYAHAFQHTQPVSNTNAPARDRIRFTRYGDEYYLTSLWNPGSGVGEALPMTKHEKELAVGTQKPAMTSIALRSSSR